jgi:hypothetical protein
MASACYECSAAFSTARSSRPRPIAATAWIEQPEGAAAAAAAEALVPQLHWVADGGGASLEAAVRLLDEVQRVAAVEAAAGRRLPPRTSQELVDACLRIADGAAAQRGGGDGGELRGAWTAFGSSAGVAAATAAAAASGPLRGFIALPPLTHSAVEAIAAVGQGYQDFGPRSL